MGDRVYLDWNATAPLRPEARAAMIEAMDVVGNPSSVHTEGRAAKMIVEKAREQVATLVDCDTEELVFTSGATEAAAAILKHTPWSEVACADIEHDCVLSNVLFNVDDESGELLSTRLELPLSDAGQVMNCCPPYDLAAIGLACGETGILMDPMAFVGKTGGDVFSDTTQAVGKIEFSLGVRYQCCSSHKIGGPKGVGAAIGLGESAYGSFINGGGQEKGRRSGTENVIGIAGFGAAAEAAQRDLDAGAWEPIEELRNDLEAALRDCAGDDLTIFGESAPRLPNTSCFAIPGWKGETQVMQLDLAGFAVSAGSACSSGKVGPSRVLKAMGFDDSTASSAIRVSMGQATTKDEVSRFIDAWTGLYKRMKTRAA